VAVVDLDASAATRVADEAHDRWGAPRRPCSATSRTGKREAAVRHCVEELGSHRHPRQQRRRRRSIGYFEDNSIADIDRVCSSPAQPAYGCRPPSSTMIPKRSGTIRQHLLRCADGMPGSPSTTPASGHHRPSPKTWRSRSRVRHPRNCVCPGIMLVRAWRDAEADSADDPCWRRSSTRCTGRARKRLPARRKSRMSWRSWPANRRPAMCKRRYSAGEASSSDAKASANEGKTP